MKGNKKILPILFFVILTLPLVFTPFTAFPWQYGKTILFQIIIEICLLFTLFRAMKRGIDWKIRFHWLDVMMVCFVVALCITSVTGVNLEQSFWMNQSRSIGVFTWIHLLIWYFLLRFTLPSKEEFKQLVQWSLGVAFVVSVTAIFQNFLPDFFRGDFGSRFSGILGNPAFFSAYILPHVGLSFWLFFETKNRLRWFYVSLGLFFSAMVWFSGIRGAFLGLIVGIVIFFITSSRDIILFFRQKKSVGFGLVAGLIVLIGLVTFFWKDSLLSSRLLNVSGFASGAETRLMAWDIGWQAFLERPLFGWGWGNYEVPFNQKFNPQFLQHGFQETVWDKPHNIVLEMLSSMGILAIFYIGIFCTAVIFLFQGSKHIFHVDRSKSIFLAILIGYIVQNLFLFDTISSVTLILFVLAIIGSSQKHRWEKTVFKNRFFSLILCLLIVYCLFLNIQFLRSSYALQSAQSYNNAFGFSEAVNKVFLSQTALKDENAILLADHLVKMEKANLLGSSNSLYWKIGALQIANVLEQYGERFPTNIAYPAWSGQIYLILGQFDNPFYFSEAVQNFVRAEQVAPQKQEIKFLLVRTYLLQKDFEKALVTAKQAVDIDPSIGQSWNFLALTSVAAGKSSDGIVQFETALKNGFSPTISQRLYLIDLFSGVKKYDFVIEQYRILIEQEPFHADWYAKLATAYVLVGDKIKALEAVQKALEIDPNLKAEADSFIQQYNLH